MGTRARPPGFTPANSVVYFVAVGNRVKIGTTTNLKRRLSGLALPGDARVLRVIPGGRTGERIYHRRFATQRIGESEWFWLEGPLAEYLASTG